MQLIQHLFQRSIFCLSPIAYISAAHTAHRPPPAHPSPQPPGSPTPRVRLQHRVAYFVRPTPWRRDNPHQGHNRRETPTAAPSGGHKTKANDHHQTPTTKFSPSNFHHQIFTIKISPPNFHHQMFTTKFPPSNFHHQNNLMVKKNS